MIEFLTGLILGYLITWPALFALLFLGVIFEHNKSSGWAIFTLILAGIIGYLMLKFPLINILWYSLGYVAIGSIWSFWRYRRHVKTEVDKIKAKWAEFDTVRREYFLKELAPNAMLDTIVYWIIVWPFSLVDNLIGDLIELTETLVKTVFKKIYNSIYESATADLK